MKVRYGGAITLAIIFAAAATTNLYAWEMPHNGFGNKVMMACGFGGFL